MACPFRWFRWFRWFRLSLMLILSFVISLTSAYAIQLQYNFKEKTVYKTIQKMSGEGSMVMGGGEEINIRLNGSFTELVRVKSVDENGNMTLMFEYTSDSFVVSIADQSQQIPSEKMKFQLKISKSGKLLDFKNLSEKSAEGEILDVSDIFATFLRFPEADIQKGDEWTISEAQSSPFGIEATGKLVGFEEIENHNCAKIKTNATMPLNMNEFQMQELEAAGVTAEGSQQVEYTSYFSTDWGVLLKGSGRMITKTEFFMNGISIGNMVMFADVNENLVDVKPEEEFEEE